MDDVEWAGDDGVTCFECDSPGPLHQHHVIPRSRGGTRTVPLCEDCHGAVHGKDLRTSALTRDALAAKKARGERTGQPPFGWQVHHFGPDTAYVPNVPRTDDLRPNPSHQGRWCNVARRGRRD